MVQQHDKQRKWRSCLGGLLALTFVFYVNYIPFHLATETHLDDSLASKTTLHQDGHDDGDADGDADHHASHRASDHDLILTIPPKSFSASALTTIFLPPVASVFVIEPEPQAPIPVFERSRPPGESPPGPQRPRAPPIA